MVAFFIKYSFYQEALDCYCRVEQFKKGRNLNYNMTFIIATHDERLCDLADKIYYLNNHKLTLNKDE